MSSILEALKKLEQEKEDTSQDVEWPQPVDTRTALHDRLVSPPSYKSVLAGIGLCLMVGASVVLLIRGLDSRSPGKKVALSQAKPSETEARPVNDPAVAMPERPAPSKPGNMARPQRPPVRPLPDNPPPETVPVNPVESVPVAVRNTDVPPPAHEIPPMAAKPADMPLPTVTEPPAETTEAELDADMAELLERIPQDLLPPRKLVESGWLKLHAISWSDDPERRIAVINAQVVKEGRRLDGALIRRIERDYVVIEKNGEQLMLPFGNH